VTASALLLYVRQGQPRTKTSTCIFKVENCTSSTL